jgi:hypothetical protein
MRPKVYKTRPLDLVGLKFNRLTAYELTGRNNYGCAIWECRCDCGKIALVRSVDLMSGHTKSCGCLQRKVSTGNSWAKTHGLSGTKAYIKTNSRKYLYNLTEDQFQQMLFDQDWCCGVCGINESDYLEMAGKGLFLDHDHKTGKIRGLLCQSCNLGLGSFRDNPEFLVKAIAWVKESGCYRNFI